MSIGEIITKIREAKNTRRGQNLFTFAIFLLIATAFWFMMVLNDDLQRNYVVEVSVDNLPENFTLLNQEMPRLSAIVKSKGRNQVRYSLGAKPHLKLNYTDFRIVDDSRLVIDNQSLNNRLREVFGSESEIVAMRPDSISLGFTTLPGEKLPVYSKVEASAAPQYIIYGNISVIPDSVVVYSPKGMVIHSTSLSTDPIAVKNLTDTTQMEVAVRVPAGCKAVPAKVRVTIPVEPLIAKSRKINIKTRNVPHGTDVLTFPAVAQINYLLPMSLYAHDTYTPQVFADYTEISSDLPTLQLHVSNMPDYYRNVEVTPTAVEFLVEHSHQE